MLREAAGVGACFGLATCGLYLLAQAVSMEISEGPALSFPTSLPALRSLANRLEELKETHFHHLLGLFMAAYIYKQTFAIPGSVFMNILAGALFGVRFGLPLVCLLTAIGASLCYTISRLFGRKLVLHYLGHRLQPLQERLNDDQRSLLFILLSLRLFPMSPNWFLNISSPILGIPLHLFFVSVLLGLLPYNYVCVQAGCVLSQLQFHNLLDMRVTLALLVATATLLGVAMLVRRRGKWTKSS